MSDFRLHRPLTVVSAVAVLVHAATIRAPAAVMVATANAAVEKRKRRMGCYRSVGCASEERPDPP